MHKRFLNQFCFLILLLLTTVFFLPLFLLITGSFMGKAEAYQRFGSVLAGGRNFASWPLLPSYPTLQPYLELLLDTPKFFVMFWNSCIQVFPALIGQLFVSATAAWGFARFEFRGKKILLSLYILLMIMPFQVTMVSSYLVLSKLHLMDTHLALILPNIFSTFPVFIMIKFFKAIPETLIEAARIDGAKETYLFFKVGIPIGSPGILSALILGFLEYWNTIEQPLTFLRNKTLWPLALYLPNIGPDNIGASLVASVIMLLPALLLFLSGQKYLEQGITASGVKE